MAGRSDLRTSSPPSRQGFTGTHGLTSGFRAASNLNCTEDLQRFLNRLDVPDLKTPSLPHYFNPRGENPDQFEARAVLGTLIAEENHS